MAVGRRYGLFVQRHLAPLSGDWALWRDFAVRSAGFPVEGLDVFGGARESERLRDVARGPAFQEAVTWQNREALGSAVWKLAAGSAASAGRRQRQEEVVASYWQRYCAKNDTIGFFGPLAWGRIVDRGAGLTVRSGALVSERVVHLETWCVQAVAGTLDESLVVPMGPFPERDLRQRLKRFPDAGVRARGLAALDRLESAREAVACARREDLFGALKGLDTVFEELSARKAERGERDPGGGRTIAYLDTMRDLDVEVGPSLVSELATSLPPLLAGSRWHCGCVYERARERLAAVVGAGPPRPLAPLVGQIFQTAWGLFAELADQTAELQRRWARLLAEDDPQTLGARAADAFADHTPAWPMSVYHSADVQIAARDTEAIDRGAFLAVIGDFHGGNNPLGQGLFALRHPSPDELQANWAADVGRPQMFLLPPRESGLVTARLFPATTRADVHVTHGPGSSMPDGYRTIGIGDLLVDNEHVTDRSGTLRAPLVEVFSLPVFVSGLRSFDPFGGDDNLRRLTIGRTVVRRAQWSAPAGDLPAEPSAIPEWARSQGMPRRAFARSPLERKPIYVDFESPTLMRVLSRFLRPAASGAPEALVAFTEMLPAPEQCWLEGDGGRYTSELRMAAVDLTRRAENR